MQHVHAAVKPSWSAGAAAALKPRAALQKHTNGAAVNTEQPSASIAAAWRVALDDEDDGAQVCITSGLAFRLALEGVCHSSWQHIDLLRADRATDT